MFDFLNGLIVTKARKNHGCRPGVEALDQRVVPVIDYPGWHGFTTVEGETITRLECNWSYGRPALDARPPSNYEVTISYGDNSPQEMGYVRSENGRYQLYSNGHSYSHWTNELYGYESYPMDIWLRDKTPPAGLCNVFVQNRPNALQAG